MNQGSEKTNIPYILGPFHATYYSILKEEAALLSERLIPCKLHGVVSQNTVIINKTVGTSNITI